MLLRRIGIPVVWLVALVGGLQAVLMLPDEHRLRGIAVVLAACVLLTFGLQLASPEQRGFVVRLTASVVGAFCVLLVISLAALPFG